MTDLDQTNRESKLTGAIVALSLALLGALLVPQHVGLVLVWPLLVLRAALSWYRGEHDTVRQTDADGGSGGRAARRLVLVPAAALLGIVAASAALQIAFDLKWSSFVWEGLPSRTVGGTTYAWPGLYTTEKLEPGGFVGGSWYGSGGPFVPLPDDSPAEAAARMAAYLGDRFGVVADPSALERTFAAMKDQPPPARLAAGAGQTDHPYTAAIAAIEDEHSGAVLRALLARTLAVSLAVLLVGAATIRLGVAGPPSWVDARPVRILLALGVVGLLVTLWTTDLDLWVFRAGAPVSRVFADHCVLLSAGALVATGLLLVSSVRHARRIGSGPAPPV